MRIDALLDITVSYMFNVTDVDPVTVTVGLANNTVAPVEFNLSLTMTGKPGRIS